MTFKSLTIHMGASLLMTTAFAVPAMANGGNNQINGLDVTITKNNSGASVKPFSLSAEEIALINGIQGVERRELVLIYAAKELDQDDRFVESGMKVMGKDWCADCAWPERSSYTFKHNKVTYKLDLVLSDNKATASK